MGIDPVAVLAVISEQASRIAVLEAEKAQLQQIIVETQEKPKEI